MVIGPKHNLLFKNYNLNQIQWLNDVSMILLHIFGLKEAWSRRLSFMLLNVFKNVVLSFHVVKYFYVV